MEMITTPVHMANVHFRCTPHDISNYWANTTNSENLDHVRSNKSDEAWINWLRLGEMNKTYACMHNHYYNEQKHTHKMRLDRPTHRGKTSKNMSTGVSDHYNHRTLICDLVDECAEALTMNLS